MGISSLTIGGQSTIGLQSSITPNKKYPYTIHQNPQIQSLQLQSTSGWNLYQIRSKRNRSLSIIRASAESTRMSTTVEKLGVKIERNPPESRLSELGVRDWPKYFSFSCFFIYFK